MSLEGLQEELDKFEGQEVVASLLDRGTELREFARDVEEKLRLVELESIQDYIAESDNLVALHDQIRLCDSTLLQMEALLGGFQVTSTPNPNTVGWGMSTSMSMSMLVSMSMSVAWIQADLGAISAEIKSLQDKSMGMGLKLKNRKVTGRSAQTQTGWGRDSESRV